MRRIWGFQGFFMLAVVLMVVAMVAGCSTTGSNDAGSVAGMVTDANTSQPLAGVVVSIGGQSYTTDANGAFGMGSIPKGQQTITAVLNGYQNYSTTITIVTGQITRHDIAMTGAQANTGSVTGTVTNDSGAPLGGVTISIGPLTVQSADDGTYTINGVPAGVQTITATCTGYQNCTGTVTVTAGQIAAYSITMDPVPIGTGTVTGTIYRADGTSPCVGALVTIDGLSATTTNDGTYTINGVAAGSQQATIKKAPYPDLPGTVQVTTDTTVYYNATLKVTRKIAGGYGHAVALKDDGTVWAWGFNSHGQVGDNSTTNRETPVQVLGPGGTGYLTNLVSVAPGNNYTVALKDDGTLWAWGYNDFGQLGDNSTAERRTPVQVLDSDGIGYLTDIVAVAAGTNHTVAVKNDGTVWAWGYNFYGQLGNNSSDDVPHRLPIQVRSTSGPGYLTNIVAVDAGSFYTVALKDDNTVWAWGYNFYGQLGINTNDSDVHSRPLQVLGTGGTGYLTDIIAVSAGDSHVVALKNNGAVWTWGYNNNGQLGDNSTTNRSAPVQVLGSGGAGYLTNIRTVDAGTFHTIALKSDGMVWMWGDNFYGQLGNNTTIDALTPVQVLGAGGEGNLTGVTAVAAGGFFTLALKDDNTLWAWGNNQYGQLGINSHDFNPHQLPLQVLNMP